MAPTVRKSRSVNKRFTNEQPSPKRSSRENKLRVSILLDIFKSDVLLLLCDVLTILFFLLIV